jgi:hypothetical protein
MILPILLAASAHAADPVRFELGADSAYVPTRAIWSRGQVGAHFSVVPSPIVAIRLEGSGWGLRDTDIIQDFSHPVGGAFDVAEAVTTRGALAVDFSPLQHAIQLWRMPWTVSAGGSLGFGVVRTVDVAYGVSESGDATRLSSYPDDRWGETANQLHPALQLSGLLAAKPAHGPGVEARAESVHWIEALDGSDLQQRQMFTVGGGLFVAF